MMRKALSFVTIMSVFVLSCGTFAAIGVPRPPIELPFEFGKAGATVSTDLYIAKDREFFFCLKFMHNPKDAADYKRVRRLVGDGTQNININKFVETGILIPLKITVSSNNSAGEKILQETECLTMGKIGHGINFIDRKIGYIHLPQGLCRVKVQCLKDIPSLADTKILLSIRLSEGKT